MLPVNQPSHHVASPELSDIPTRPGSNRVTCPPLGLIIGLPILASLVACAVLGISGLPLKEAFASRTVALSMSHALAIGIPLCCFIPWLIQRIPRAGFTLLTSLTVGTVAITTLGCLLACVLLGAMGILTQDEVWRVFAQNVRIATLLALAGAAGSLAYDTLARRLRRAEDLLREKELEQARASKLSAQAQLARLAAQIHPHFLFNTLNAIGSLMPNAPDRAERMLNRLSELLRAFIDMASKPVVRLEEEMALVTATLELESARFGDRLQVKLDDFASYAQWPVPPHAIQGLVENALKHSIAPRVQGGRLTISFHIAKDGLHVDVVDDGPGFELTAIQQGHGLDHLVSRLEVMYGERARLEVRRDVDGCRVTLVIPSEQDV